MGASEDGLLQDRPALVEGLPLGPDRSESNPRIILIALAGLHVVPQRTAKVRTYRTRGVSSPRRPTPLGRALKRRVAHHPGYAAEIGAA